MKTNKVLDPQGRELRMFLLQVMERDKEGQPTVCRVRYDHEKIDPTDGPDGQAVFLLVWSATNKIHGELWLKDLTEEFEEMKEKFAQSLELKRQQAAQIVAAQQSLESYELEIKEKTEALRALQKERDPQRLESMVAERTAAATLALGAKLRDEQVKSGNLEREVAELKASKKKLREALERERAK